MADTQTNGRVGTGQPQVGQPPQTGARSGVLRQGQQTPAAGGQAQPRDRSQEKDARALHSSQTGESEHVVFQGSGGPAESSARAILGGIQRLFSNQVTQAVVGEAASVGGNFVSPATTLLAISLKTCRALSPETFKKANELLSGLVGIIPNGTPGSEGILNQLCDSPSSIASDVVNKLTEVVRDPQFVDRMMIKIFSNGHENGSTTTHNQPQTNHGTTGNPTQNTNNANGTAPQGLLGTVRHYGGVVLNKGKEIWNNYIVGPTDPRQLEKAIAERNLKSSWLKLPSWARKGGAILVVAYPFYWLARKAMTVAKWVVLPSAFAYVLSKAKSLIGWGGNTTQNPKGSQVGVMDKITNVVSSAANLGQDPVGALHKMGAVKEGSLFSGLLKGAKSLLSLGGKQQGGPATAHA